MKKRETNVFCRAFSVILTLMHVVSVMPAAFAEPTPAAASGAIQIIPYQDFETNYDANQWVNNAAGTKLPVADGKLGETRTSDGFSGSDWAYPEEVSAKLADGTIKKIVILANAELKSRTEYSCYSGISLVDSAANNGDTPIQKLFAIQNRNGSDDGRLRSYSTENKDEVNTSRTESIPFNGDLAAVIEVGADGKTGTVTYYHDGKRMQTTAQIADKVVPPLELNLEGTKHIRFSLHGQSTGYFDNVEAYALAADSAAMQYVGAETVSGKALQNNDTIAPRDSVVLKFDTPVRSGSMYGKIFVNGAVVSDDCLSLSEDRRSITVGAQQGGYESGALTVAATDVEDYTGAKASANISLTVQPTVDKAGRIQIMPYQDFETNYDIGQWNKNSAAKKFPVPENGKLGDVRNESGFSCGDWAYPADFNTKLTDGTIKKIIILGTAELEKNGVWEAYSAISLVNSAANDGDHPIQKLFAVQHRDSRGTDGRLRSYSTSNGDNVNTSRIETIPFKGDLAAVIEVGADGKTGKATYYQNGKIMKTTADASNPTEIPPQTITLDGTTHVRFSLHNNSTGYFDNTEAYAITSDNPTINYLGAADANGNELNDGDYINSSDSIVLKFDTPILPAALEGGVSVNGTVVPTDRLSVSEDRHSVIIAAEQYGYSGGELTVTAADVEGYAGEKGSATVNLMVRNTVPDGVIEIMHFQDFETNFNANQWRSYADWSKFSSPVNGKLGDARNSSGFSCGDWAFPSDFNTKLTSGEIKRLVVLAKAELEDINGSDRVEISLVDSPNNVGGEPIQKLFAVQYLNGGNDARLRSYHSGKSYSETETEDGIAKEVKANENDLYTARVTSLPFNGDLAAVIDIDAGGTTGQASYYYNGARLRTTAPNINGQEVPPLPVNLNGVKHLRFSLHNNSTGYFDNAEVLAVTADAAPVQYLGATLPDGSEIPKDGIDMMNGNFALTFDLPVIQDSLKGAIKINGLVVKPERLSLSDDRRTVIVKAPSNGYPQEELNVTIAENAFMSYTGKGNAAVTETIKTKGTTASVGVTAVSRTDNSVTATIGMRNGDSAGRELLVIMAETANSDNSYILNSVQTKNVTMTDASAALDITLDGVTEDSTVKVFIWDANTLAPILKDVYIVD